MVSSNLLIMFPSYDLETTIVKEQVGVDIKLTTVTSENERRKISHMSVSKGEMSGEPADRQQPPYLLTIVWR